MKTRKLPFKADFFSLLFVIQTTRHLIIKENAHFKRLALSE